MVTSSVCKVTAIGGLTEIAHLWWSAIVGCSSDQLSYAILFSCLSV